MTPVLFRPIEHGIDIVVYSTTKFIGGHGVHIGGAIVDSGKFPWAEGPGRSGRSSPRPDPAYHGMVFEEALRPIGNIAYILHIRTHWLRDTGACMSPFAAFLFLLGLETLHLRMERHCAERAGGGASSSQQHPAVAVGELPGPAQPPRPRQRRRSTCRTAQGAILGFGIKGGTAAGVKFINSVKLASHLANIGDAKTLVIHPASTTHSQLTPEEQAADRRDARVRAPVGRHRGRGATSSPTSTRRWRRRSAERRRVRRGDAERLSVRQQRQRAQRRVAARTRRCASRFGEPLALELGGDAAGGHGGLRDLRPAQRRARDNAVLICHAISGDSHVARHDGGDDPGWWDIVVGPGRPIDTERYFVICPNVLGGCRGTTGPNSIDPRSGPALRRRFPDHHRRRHGGGAAPADRPPRHRRAAGRWSAARWAAIRRSTWAMRHPDRVPGLRRRWPPRRASPARRWPSTSSGATPSCATRATRGGQYYDGGPGPAVGLAIARMLAHITYLSREAMTREVRRRPARAARRRHRLREELLGRLVPRLPGRQVRRALRRQQLRDAVDGDGPVRPRRDRPTRCEAALGAEPLPLAGGQLHAATGCSRPSRAGRSSTR